MRQSSPLIIVTVLLVVGCDSRPKSTRVAAESPPTTANPQSGSAQKSPSAYQVAPDALKAPLDPAASARPVTVPSEQASPKPASPGPAVALPDDSPPAAENNLSSRPLPGVGSNRLFNDDGPPEIDAATLMRAGIRRMSGRFIDLYTDLPETPEINALPDVFDAAVPLWAAYFAVPLDKTRGWRPSAMVMQRRDRFQTLGLLPADLPPFLNGFQRGSQLWIFEQPSDYYRRHLLLHEGTHAFMNRFLGGSGPPWYMEGIAELLATHQWQSDPPALSLNWMPDAKEAVDHWGRIKIVRDEFVAGRGKSLSDIFAYSDSAHLRVEPYGWCWAACVFLDRHPQFQDRFRRLATQVTLSGPRFSAGLVQAIGREMPALNEQWQLFVVNLDYGYDIAREAIEFRESLPLPATGADVTLEAARGWQSSGFQLEAGREYQITAEGRYQVADEPAIWWCEPNGVTIRYHRDHPLGMLMGAVHQTDYVGLTPLADPQPIGSMRTIRPLRSGTLMLRINDSAAELSDNAGNLRVRIETK